MDSIASTASLLGPQSALPDAKAPRNMAAIDKAANDFESIVIAQFIGTMFSGLKTDGIMGGGQGEEMFRSFMTDQYAQGLQARGGFGLAASVKAQMLKMQEG